MDKIFVNFLPPWVETNIQPAFYDKESGSVLQQTARMYAKVNCLVRMFNKLSKETKETVEDYIARFVALKDFVDTYFENLDVQEEINNKLDKMVEDGTLQEIVASYLQANVAWTFDSVSDMQDGKNLVSGSYAQTIGFYSANDGGGAIYLIRDPKESETANGITTFAVHSLIAEWVNTDIYINLKQLGLSTSLSDNSPIIQYAVTNNAGASVLFVPQGGEYACGSAVDIANKAITVKGTSAPDYNDPSETTLVFASSNGFTNCRNATFKDLCIKGDTATPANIGISGGACVDNCIICYFQTGISCSYQGPSIINNCNIHNNSGSGITNPVDSRITNNTINSNGGNGINLQAGANDNIICNNKIEWNGGIGISNYNANHNIINGNIIDRSGNTGCYIGGSSSHNVLTDNVFRRNGATGSSYNASNIHLNGANNGSTFANNITLTGNSLDDGSGTTVPNRSIYIDDSTTNPILLLNNTLTGGTNATPVYKTNSSNVTIIDSNNPVYESLLIKKENLNVPANGTRDFTIPFHDAPAQYGQGTYRKLVITTRNASDAGYGIKEIYVMLYQQYGSYKVAFSDTTVRTNITLSGTYDSDNQAVIVTVTSADATQYQVCMNTYSN